MRSGASALVALALAVSACSATHKANTANSLGVVDTNESSTPSTTTDVGISSPPGASETTVGDLPSVTTLPITTNSSPDLPASSAVKAVMEELVSASAATTDSWVNLAECPFGDVSGAVVGTGGNWQPLDESGVQIRTDENGTIELGCAIADGGDDSAPLFGVVAGSFDLSTASDFNRGLMDDGWQEVDAGGLPGRLMVSPSDSGRNAAMLLLDGWYLYALLRNTPSDWLITPAETIRAHAAQWAASLAAYDPYGVRVVPATES